VETGENTRDRSSGGSLRPAVGYLRVSGRGQVEGHGFDRQEADIRAFAAGRFQVERIYREAHTGTEAERPELTRMVADLLANGCRTVVVASLDRFARDLGVQMQLLAAMRARGIALFSAATGEDVTAALDEDPMARALVQIQGAFFELDKALTVRKLRVAREARRKERGRCEGRKPYGCRPGEDVVLEEVFRLRVGRHLSYGAIARALNDGGRTTRYGRRWSAMTVKRIVDRGRPHVECAKAAVGRTGDRQRDGGLEHRGADPTGRGASGTDGGPGAGRQKRRRGGEVTP